MSTPMEHSLLKIIDKQTVRLRVLQARNLMLIKGIRSKQKSGLRMMDGVKAAEEWDKWTEDVLQAKEIFDSVEHEMLDATKKSDIRYNRLETKMAELENNLNRLTKEFDSKTRSKAHEGSDALRLEQEKNKLLALKLSRLEIRNKGMSSTQNAKLMALEGRIKLLQAKNTKLKSDVYALVNRLEGLAFNHDAQSSMESLVKVLEQENAA